MTSEGIWTQPSSLQYQESSRHFCGAYPHGGIYLPACQTGSGIGKMSKADMLARCHTSGKIWASLTQEIQPPRHCRWRYLMCRQSNRAEGRGEMQQGWLGRCGCVTRQTENSRGPRRSPQQHASSCLNRVCHTSVAERRGDPNITRSVWRWWDLHFHTAGCQLRNSSTRFHIGWIKHHKI